VRPGVLSTDVVIVGGGIAGALLARHLKLAHPGLDVLVLEAASAITDFKVGESTVEVAAHYMIKRLGLGAYLYQHQLPKNGLRFFFDSEKKDLPLHEMSEIGSDHLPFHPSFQLERAAFERDLATMNAASGIDVRLGAKVTAIAVGTDGAPHEVTFDKEGERHVVSCRWLCDASGRRHVLNRARGAKVHKEERLPTAAAWGRYRNVAGLDAVDDPTWRARVRHTSRHLSTNHLMYDGYWIWFIPLAGDLMSVGVVFDKDRVQGPRTAAELEAFLASHRAARDLLAGATQEDFQSFQHLPYYSDEYFSKDRWALTGESGAFTDPFYSPGSDFIATANELIVSMIGADLAGDPRAFAERVDVANAFYRFKYEATLRLYAKLYPVFGTFEVFRLKFLLDFNNYYNMVAWPFMADKLHDLPWLRGELGIGERILMAQSTMADHFVAYAARLREQGAYFDQNAGRFANGLDGVWQFERKLGPVLDDEFRRAEVQKAYASVFATVLERVTARPGIAARARVLSELNLPTVVRFTSLDDASVGKLFERIELRLARDLGREFPATKIERVRLDGPSGVAVDVATADAPARASIEARATELWSARGASLTEPSE
jgi:flavin-dependent dehydrogenase